MIYIDKKDLEKLFIEAFESGYFGYLDLKNAVVASLIEKVEKIKFGKIKDMPLFEPYFLPPADRVGYQDVVMNNTFVNPDFNFVASSNVRAAADSNFVASSNIRAAGFDLASGPDITIITSSDSNNVNSDNSHVVVN